MNYMIYLETLSTRPDAAIMQIGLAAFNEKEVVKNALWITMPDSGHIDTDTVTWWFRQIANGVPQPIENPMPLSDALMDLRSRMKEIDTVWAYPSHFDIPILQSAFDRCGMPTPWTHRQIRCTRTLALLFPEIKRIAPETKHWADTYAIAQARWTIELLKHIKDL